jgi:ribosomal protein L6P/L9E
MRYIFSNELLEIPENVKIKIRSRIVTVEGPRGEIPSLVDWATTPAHIQLTNLPISQAP